MYCTALVAALPCHRLQQSHHQLALVQSHERSYIRFAYLFIIKLIYIICQTAMPREPQNIFYEIAWWIIIWFAYCRPGTSILHITCQRWWWWWPGGGGAFKLPHENSWTGLSKLHFHNPPHHSMHLLHVLLYSSIILIAYICTLANVNVNQSSAG